MLKSFSPKRFIKQISVIILLSLIYLLVWKAIIMLSLTLGYFFKMNHYQVLEVAVVIGFVIGTVLPTYMHWHYLKIMKHLNSKKHTKV